MRIVLEHLRAKILNLIRQPAYLVGTLFFPSLFFLFFAAPNAVDAASANLLMASFAAFAVLGVVFFQFGLDFAIERESTWFKYLGTLPIRPWQFFIARSLTALIFAILAAAVVQIVVFLTTPADASFSQLLKLNSVLLIGSLPFCLMGLSIGYFASPSAAAPVTNLIYLILSFAGGLWVPPAGLNPTIQKISEYFPTRFYAEWAWQSLSVGDLKPQHLAALAAWGLLAIPIAWWGHRRAQTSR